MRVALITGIAGQDGSYLAEFLLGKGYQVFGVVLPGAEARVDNIRHLLDSVTLVAGDLTDQGSLDAAVRAARPDEVYNLAAQSSVPMSWKHPVMTEEVTGLGVTRLLDALRRFSPQARFFQASSAQIFGQPTETPQTERTPVRPRNPYGASKAYADSITRGTREMHGMFACSGILYNHESPRRGLEFVVRKVTHAAARIKLGLDRELRIGSLDARRDWGFAGDYVQAMWLMLQQKDPDDFIIASGRARSVRELVQTAFQAVGLDGERYLVQDQSLLRPDEAPLVGDPAKAKAVLGWSPSVSFGEMIETMVRKDLEAFQSPTPR